MKDWLIKHWRNGLRFQLAISILILGGVIALYLQLYQFTHEKDQQHLHIVDVRVVSASVKTGGDLLWVKTMCNDTEKPITAAVSLSVETANEPLRTLSVQSASFSDTIEPGCHQTPIRSFELPADVAAGEWRLKITIFTTGLLLANKSSDPFTVGAQ